jgi:hypothetical protein
MASVPTPFQHLIYAQRVLGAGRLPAEIVRKLDSERGAFLFGSTAGDVQVMTGQPRAETHFYRLSEPHELPAAERFLIACPELGDPEQLSPTHAAFVSGYLVHLAWDEAWARDIFIPCYQGGSQWPDRMAYFLHHNALRLYLDRDAYERLRDAPGLVAALRGVAPDGWLPFATSSALVDWRDWLVEQLMDPAKIQTAAVFAARMKVPTKALEEVVTEIAGGTYRAVSDLGALLARYEAAALAESTHTLLRYWGIGDRLTSRAAGPSITTRCEGAS